MLTLLVMTRWLKNRKFHRLLHSVHWFADERMARRWCPPARTLHSRFCQVETSWFEDGTTVQWLELYHRDPLTVDEATDAIFRNVVGETADVLVYGQVRPFDRDKTLPDTFPNDGSWSRRTSHLTRIFVGSGVGCSVFDILLLPRTHATTHARTRLVLPYIRPCFSLGCLKM